MSTPFVSVDFAACRLPVMFCLFWSFLGDGIQHAYCDDYEIAKYRLIIVAPPLHQDMKARLDYIPFYLNINPNANENDGVVYEDKQKFTKFQMISNLNISNYSDGEK